MKIEKNVLKIEPNIPADWKEYSIRYRYVDSIYNIKVANKSGKKNGIISLKINGKQLDNKVIILQNTGLYNIEVEI